MNKKYILTNRTIRHQGHILRQIKAIVSFGCINEDDLGGFVQSEKNLSQQGECWIYPNAKVFDRAVVKDNAILTGRSQAKGSAVIRGEALIENQAIIKDNAIIEGDAVISGNSIIGGNVIISDDLKQEVKL